MHKNYFLSSTFAKNKQGFTRWQALEPFPVASDVELNPKK